MNDRNPIRIIRRRRPLLALAIGVLIGGATQSQANAAEPTTARDALVSGKLAFQLRYRFESVDDDAFRDRANASTAKLRLSYESRPWRHAQWFVEVDHIAAVGAEAYDSTRNGRVTRPVVADPPATDLNQAGVRLSGSQDELVVGRQRLSLDNQRFIGGVAWRQNEQTMDAVTWRSKRVPRTDILASYIDNVNRIFGPDRGVPPADLRSRGVVLAATVDGKSLGKLAVFAHQFDFRNAAPLSHQNIGALWTGNRKLGAVTGSWSLSFAEQADAADNPTDYSANYWQAEFGVSRGAWAFKLGQESLAGDATRPERRFQTPLATLHAFQGWADKFLTTPAQGVDDRYGIVTAKWHGVDMQLAYHDFRAEAASRDYGSEWDASIARRAGSKVDLLLKVARYRSDGLGSDATKWWLQATIAIP